jgi:uncharacterized membrane protein
MSDLIAVSFRGEDTADQVLNKLLTMPKEHLLLYFMNDDGEPLAAHLGTNT